jgi:hypothetical protein
MSFIKIFEDAMVFFRLTYIFKDMQKGRYLTVSNMLFLHVKYEPHFALIINF